MDVFQPIPLFVYLYRLKPISPMKKLITNLLALLGLATAWSQPLTMERSGENTVRLTLPIDSLAKGCFYASIGVYRCDELGRMLPLDHISHAFKFEASGLPVWNVNAHGYMHLPQIRAACET